MNFQSPEVISCGGRKCNGVDCMRTNEIFNRLADFQPSILGEENYKKYSLLIPLVEQNQETHLLFEVRSMMMRSQPGDVCFPGGKIDDTDRNELHGVLRETEEELGLDERVIKNVTPLDYIVSDFGRIIYPFVGEIMTLDALSINQAEVAEVFTVPLQFFLENEPDKYKINFEIIPEKNFPYHLIQGGKDYDWRPRQMDELFYEYDNRIIWGLTARIIAHFVALLKELER